MDSIKFKYRFNNKKKLYYRKIKLNIMKLVVSN